MAVMRNGHICIYDIDVDELRPITLEDVARLEIIQRAYGQLREALKRIHEEAVADIKSAPLVDA